MPRDPFDPEALQMKLPPELMATLAKPAARRKARKYYYAPTDWADRAAAAVVSAGQLIIAFRLYRCWRMRDPTTESVVASNVALGGRGITRKAKGVTLSKLSERASYRLYRGAAGKRLWSGCWSNNCIRVDTVICIRMDTDLYPHGYTGPIFSLSFCLFLQYLYVPVCSLPEWWLYMMVEDVAPRRVERSPWMTRCCSA